MKIGYARVSTTGQNLEPQKEFLANAGCEKIFSKKASDTKVNRKEFNAMMEFAREGDQIVVALSRSSLNLKNTSKRLQDKKIDLKVLEQNIDTSAPSRKLLFNMAGIVAEFEREAINERAAEGRKAAMISGVRFGGKKTLEADEIGEIKKLVSSGLSKKKVGKKFGVSRSTIYRILENRQGRSGQ